MTSASRSPPPLDPALQRLASYPGHADQEKPDEMDNHVRKEERQFVVPMNALHFALFPRVTQLVKQPRSHPSHPFAVGLQL